MFEHPSFTYDSIVVEQKRVDRANELRRIIAENPARIVPRAHPVLDRMRGWFGAGRADAAASEPRCDSSRINCDQVAIPAHAQ